MVQTNQRPVRKCCHSCWFMKRKKRKNEQQKQQRLHFDDPWRRPGVWLITGTVLGEERVVQFVRFVLEDGSDQALPSSVNPDLREELTILDM